MNVDSTEYIVIDSSAVVGDSFKWDEASTRLLLDEYKRHLNNLGKGPALRTKSQLWSLITEELNKYGYNLTPVQIRNRYTTLERAFKRRQSTNKSSQNSVDQFYDSELKSILTKKTYIDDSSLCDETSKSNLLAQDLNMSSGYEELVETIPLGSQLNGNAVAMKDPADLYKWNNETTQLLFDIYEETQHDRDLMSQFRTKNRMWIHITEKLNEYGYTFSSVQVLNRVKTLERAYKKYIIKKKRSNGHKLWSFPFERYIKKIMNERADQLNEVAKTDEEFNEIGIDTQTNNAKNVVVPNQTSTSCYSNVAAKPVTDESSLIHEIRLLREENSRFQQELLNVHREKYALLQEENILLKENNDLLRRLVEKVSYCNSPKTIIENMETGFTGSSRCM